MDSGYGVFMSHMYRMRQSALLESLFLPDSLHCVLLSTIVSANVDLQWQAADLHVLG